MARRQAGREEAAPRAPPLSAPRCCVATDMHTAELIAPPHGGQKRKPASSTFLLLRVLGIQKSLAVHRSPPGLQSPHSLCDIHHAHPPGRAPPPVVGRVSGDDTPSSVGCLDAGSPAARCPTVARPTLRVLSFLCFTSAHTPTRSHPAVIWLWMGHCTPGPHMASAD